MQWKDVDCPTFSSMCISAINWLDYRNSFLGIQTFCLWQTICILERQLLVSGQYYAELTVKLLDVIKQKYCRKLLLRSVTFSRQCTTTRITGCSASCLRLWICSTEPFCLQSRLGSQRLFPNKKSELPSSWNLVHSWWIIDDRYVEAWFESQNKKNSYFQCLSNWEDKLKKCIDVARKYVEKLQYIWYNILIFNSQVAKLFDCPSRMNRYR